MLQRSGTEHLWQPAGSRRHRERLGGSGKLCQAGTGVAAGTRTDTHRRPGNRRCRRGLWCQGTRIRGTVDNGGRRRPLIHPRRRRMRRRWGRWAQLVQLFRRRGRHRQLGLYVSGLAHRVTCRPMNLAHRGSRDPVVIGRCCRGRLRRGRGCGLRGRSQQCCRAGPQHRSVACARPGVGGPHVAEIIAIQCRDPWSQCTEASGVGLHVAGLLLTVGHRILRRNHRARCTVVGLRRRHDDRRLLGRPISQCHKVGVHPLMVSVRGRGTRTRPGRAEGAGRVHPRGRRNCLQLFCVSVQLLGVCHRRSRTRSRGQHRVVLFRAESRPQMRHERAATTRPPLPSRPRWSRSSPRRSTELPQTSRD